MAISATTTCAPAAAATPGGFGDDILISGQGFTDQRGTVLRAVSDGGFGDDHIIAESYATLTGGWGRDVFDVGSGLIDHGLVGVVITDFRPGITS